MVFSSILFLIWFVPAVFLIYCLAPKACRNGVLLAASLLFYGWSSPWWLVLILGDCLVGYVCGRLIESSDQKRRKAAMIAGIVFVLSLLSIFKYWNFFAENLYALNGIDWLIHGLVLPAGISFYTFQVISYLVDVYRDQAPVQRSFWRFALYVCMFFQLIAGPIVRYASIEPELTDRTLSLQQTAEGSRRFLCGLFKKVLLANPFFALAAFHEQQADPCVLFFWIRAISVTMYVYYDFSGYSDMAIGLGRMMGFHLPENFNYPFMAGSFREFWRRWHMSLTTWFKDYVYIPLGGNRKGKERQIRNLFVVWLLTGLWHGAAWNFVLWGLLFFVLLTAENFVIPEKFQKSLLYKIAVRIAICISFVLFYDSTLFAFGQDLSAMFGLAGLPFVNGQSGYILRSSIVLLLLGACGATPWPKQLVLRMNTRYGWFSAAGAIASALLLVVTISRLAAGTYNPFLYFQF